MFKLLGVLLKVAYTMPLTSVPIAVRVMEVVIVPTCRGLYD